MTKRRIARPEKQHRLCWFTYDDIARLADLTPHTVRLYAWRGKYNPRDLDDVLRFIAAHRAKRGLTPIGTTL